jgi:hypothetical protein
MENGSYIFPKLDHMKTMPELLSHGCPTAGHNFAELQAGPLSVRGHSLGRGVRSVLASALPTAETRIMGTMIGLLVWLPITVSCFFEHNSKEQSNACFS